MFKCKDCGAQFQTRVAIYATQGSNDTVPACPECHSPNMDDLEPVEVPAGQMPQGQDLQAMIANAVAAALAKQTPPAPNA